ncbi:MAG: hypothetical protein ACJAQ3_002479 [Planctomycetota bacterium]|jgi:hypothetical protein
MSLSSISRPALPVTYPSRAAALIAILASTVLPGCIVLEHVLDQRPVGASNLQLENGLLWQQSTSLELNGIWVDSNGSRMRIDLHQGLGRVFVESEDAKFFWTQGEMLVKENRVQLKRLLGSDTVDQHVGTLDFGGDRYPDLIIDFKDLGQWRREAQVRFDGEWMQGESHVQVRHATGNYEHLRVTGDLATGWVSAAGQLTGSTIIFSLKSADGSSSPVAGRLTVGLPRLPADIQ